MNILAIESSSIVCGCALYVDKICIDIDEIVKPQIHSERLPVVVNKILRDNNIIASNLDGIAVSNGPGSYTGLRIGLSLAKGLAASAKIPIIPISTLEVINCSISRSGKYWVVLHSHKNIVFAQRFNSGKPDSRIECREFDSKRYKNVVGFNLDKFYEQKKYEFSAPSSKNVGKLGIEKFNQLAEKNISLIVPNYISNINNKRIENNDC